MLVTVSENYQVVIPKAARKKLGIVAGQKIRVKSVGTSSITFEREPTMQELLAKGAGLFNNAPWAKAGIDPAVWLRQERDKE